MDIFIVYIKARATSRRYRTFNYPILLGSVNTRILVDYLMFLVIAPDCMVEVFGAIIRSKNLNLCLKMGFNHKVEVNHLE